MAKDTRGDSLARLGPVAGPVLGVVLAVAFIAAAVMTNPIGDQESELRASIQRIEGRLESSERTAEEDYDAPLVDSVEESLSTREADDWRPPVVMDQMTDMPIEWYVVMEGPQVDEFTEYDEDGNGFWSEEEFQRTPYYLDPEPDDPRGKFDNWDRNGDEQISRAEYNDPPIDDDELWDQLDENNDGELTAEEISPEQMRAWDRYPYDDLIEKSEFRRRHEPQESRNFGPPANVRTSFDPENSEIVTTWEPPQLQNLPEDISYIIWRHAPETVEDRRSIWREEMSVYRADLRNWESSHLDPWVDNLSDAYKNEHDAGFPQGQRRHFESLDAEGWYESISSNEYRRHVGLPEIPEDADDATRAEIDAESRRMLDEVFGRVDTTRPVAPSEPDEWERVTDTPISGTEFRDSDFEFGITYTYAVQMGSQAHPPTRDAVDETELVESIEGTEEYFVFSDRTRASTPPVRAQNRVSVGYRGASSSASTLSLTTWISHREDGDVTWYRVRVVDVFEPDDDVGSEYTFAELVERDAVLIDARGAEAAIDSVLDAGIGRVDFSTGFRYEGLAGGEVIMTSPDLGDGVVPTGDAAEFPTHSPLGMDNPTEVRALAVRSRGQSALFELTRWHLAGDGEWLRVVLRHEVESGAAIGMPTGLSGDVRVFDAAGNELTGADLQAHRDEEVDLTVGNFGGLEGRAVLAGELRFDLFGTLYVEPQG